MAMHGRSRRRIARESPMRTTESVTDIMSDSTVLRKRGGGNSPSPTHQGAKAKISTHHRSYPDDNDIEMIMTGASRGSGVVRRHFPFILKVSSTVLLIAGLFRILVSPPRSDIVDEKTTQTMGSMDILSTVPLGFTLDIPTNLGAIEIYLDSRRIRSIGNVVKSFHSTTTPKDADDDNDASNKLRQHVFGTCDIKDHGENVLGHAFSLENADSMDSSIHLSPGEHIIGIHHREHKNEPLVPYAHMTVNVDAPPELVLDESTFFHKSPYETAYKLALTEIGNNIACNHFVAGTGWSQLWTRDTSYAAELGASILHPDIVKQSLMASVEKWKNKKEVWLQDTCGHFGGWPNLSDAIVGVRGAWSLYLVTGDKEFLEWAYEVTIASLQRAEEEVLDRHSGLFLGCSSFLESNSGYPEKYEDDGELVGLTKALSTNMLYYSGYKYASKMGKELGIFDVSIEDLEDKASLLKSSIQSRLWSPTKKNYAYFEDEYGMLVDTTEGLGTSLALLEFDDDDRNEMMLKSTYTTDYGITCLWPPFEYSAGFMEWRIPRHYHNGRLWPFVQGYWAMAVAQHRRDDLLSEALQGITLLSQKGNTFAEFYNLTGTFPKERRSQLWSATGYVSMIYHGVFGIRLELDGIRFNPMKPAKLFQAPIIHLNNLQYREMILNIHLHGLGTTVQSFALNGVKQNEPFIGSDKAGIIDVHIALS